MKIDKRYIVGTILAIPMLPIILLGFLAYWLHLYAVSGYNIGELSYEWLEKKLEG